MSDAQALQSAGWVRRSVAREPRLGEIVGLYEELGFEVWLEPLAPDDPACRATGCTICFADPEALTPLKIVWTRRAERPVDPAP